MSVFDDARNVCRNVLCCESAHQGQGTSLARQVGVPPWLFAVAGSCSCMPGVAYKYKHHDNTGACLKLRYT